MPQTICKAEPRKILVVDDNADSNDLMQMLLQDEGHDVATAHDGFAAIEAADRRTPDIIFSDLVLPDFDGFELCRRLRSQARFERTVIFAVSGRSDSESIERAADAGFDYFAVKPVEIDILFQSVDAPRQGMLILLSRSLIESSKHIRQRCDSLSQRSRIAVERSIQLLRRFEQK